MKWLESIVAYLAPSILLDGTPWKSEWRERERESFVTVLSIWCVFTTVGYVAHFFFFDKANNLEPIELWFRFRMLMALAGFGCLLFYISPLTKSRFYKLPAIVLLWLMSYMQSKVTVWYSLDAWLFCFILIIGSVLVLRLSPIKSLVFTIVTIITLIPALTEAGLSISYLVSTSIVTVLFVGVVRSANLSDVRNFLLEQENASAQRQIIEMNSEFAERIRAFIPRVIAERLDHLINEKRLSILQASVEVLRPETRDVACLFSDIRGFTQGSKELQQFINDSVLPEVRACSDVVEKYSGIPRKIGDLVFAYFDDVVIERNVVRALLSAIEMSQVNADMNKTVTSVEVKRFILISAGPAIVGNIGGLDSSMEITALGSPVNFLSRLDEATKAPKLAEQLEVGDILISERAVEIIQGLAADVDLKCVTLASCDVELRDFPETTDVFVMKPTDANHTKLTNLLKTELGSLIGSREDNRFAAAI